MDGFDNFSDGLADRVQDLCSVERVGELLHEGRQGPRRPSGDPWHILAHRRGFAFPIVGAVLQQSVDLPRGQLAFELLGKLLRLRIGQRDCACGGTGDLARDLSVGDRLRASQCVGHRVVTRLREDSRGHLNDIADIDHADRCVAHGGGERAVALGRSGEEQQPLEKQVGPQESEAEAQFLDAV